MKTGYLYEINGKVFVNPEEEPSKFLFYDDDIHLKESEYKKALKEWQANCIPVVNYYQCGKDEYRIELTETSISPCIVFGQKCEYSVKNGKSTISKLL